jgi:hypothetical protein
MADCNVSRAQFDAIKAQNSELKQDAAIWRSLIIIGEVGVAALGGYAAATGNFGAFQTNDSLVRTGALVGSLAAGTDAVRRGKSVYNMLGE